MAKSRWVHVQFLGGIAPQYKGYDIHSVEVFYSDSRLMREEYLVSPPGDIRPLGHFASVEQAQQFIDVIAGRLS